MRKKYIIPDLVVVDLGLYGDVLDIPINTSYTEEVDAKGGGYFCDDDYSSGGVSRRGSIWDNEW